MKSESYSKVLIADDHSILRDGIRLLVGRIKNMKVVGEASNGLDAINKYNYLSPDLVILDISMPEKNGMDVAKEILHSSPEANIIILSMYDDKDYINRCLELGVKGYVVKSESGSELEDAINSVMGGNTYFSSQVQRVIFSMHSRSISRNKQIEQIVKLTKREIEIIKLISDGLTSQEMADKLFISPRTVETHRSNLLKKVGVKNALELVKKAEQLNLLG